MSGVKLATGHRQIRIPAAIFTRPETTNIFDVFPNKYFIALFKQVFELLFVPMNYGGMKNTGEKVKLPTHILSRLI
jgi:hypothetical protein